MRREHETGSTVGGAGNSGARDDPSDRERPADQWVAEHSLAPAHWSECGEREQILCHLPTPLIMQGQAEGPCQRGTTPRNRTGTSLRVTGGEFEHDVSGGKHVGHHGSV